MIHKIYTLSIEEKQILYRLLRKKGLEHDEASKRVYKLNKLQKKLAKKLHAKNKPEEHIKSKLQERFVRSLEKLGQEMEK